MDHDFDGALCDEVDPLAVLDLNLLSLEYALTPERVALARRLDLRPFPFLRSTAHDCMSDAGLRFPALGTARHRGAYRPTVVTPIR